MSTFVLHVYPIAGNPVCAIAGTSFFGGNMGVKASFNWAPNRVPCFPPISQGALGTQSTCRQSVNSGPIRGSTIEDPPTTPSSHIRSSKHCPNSSCWGVSASCHIQRSKHFQEAVVIFFWGGAGVLERSRSRRFCG